MSMPGDSDERGPALRRDLWLTALTSLGPITWLVVLVLLYVSTSHESEMSTPVRSWYVWAIGSGISLTTVVILALQNRRGLPRFDREPRRARMRVAFMTRAGFGLSLLSLILLLGFALPLAFEVPCE